MVKLKEPKSKKLAKSLYTKDKFRKMVPSQQINEGWHYYKLHGLNNIIGIRVILSETYVVTEKAGQPVINPNTKAGIFEWNQKVESRILTEEQYDNIIASGFEDEE